MMRRRLAIVAALSWPLPALATEAGLDIGRIVDGAVVHDNNAAVDSTGTPWIRLNLRLDDWTAPDDDTRRGPDQLTWFEAYDRIVDDYLARGIQVYALINDEAVYSRAPHGRASGSSCGLRTVTQRFAEPSTKPATPPW